MRHATSNSVTVREAASQLGYTQKYVRDLLYEQRLPGAYKNGRVWRIPVLAIADRLTAREGRNGQRE
jgi:excisionase family DNA binding protein